MKKSFTKTKNEATHEFFKQGASKKSGFTFNAAPVNKDAAKKELKMAQDEGRAVAGAPSKKQRSTFMAKLYKDEDDLNELKMMAGDDNFDSDIESKDDEQEGAPTKRRDAKLQSKREARGLGSQTVSSIKIPRLVSNFNSSALHLTKIIRARSQYKPKFYHDDNLPK